MSEQFLITNTNSVQQVSRNYYIITRLGPLPWLHWILAIPLSVEWTEEGWRWQGVRWLTLVRMCVWPQLQDTLNHFHSNVMCFIYCSSIRDRYMNQMWNCWKMDCSCF